jgi:hypothetical protein
MRGKGIRGHGTAVEDFMTDLVEFLFPAPAERSVGGILKWWESRRLPYNVMVGGAGLVTLGAFRVFTWLISEPFLMWQPIVVFGVAANLCYLLGPAVEIAVDRIWGRKVLPMGPALYRMGLTFSVGLALLPALIFTVMSVVVMVLKVFGGTL